MNTTSTNNTAGFLFAGTSGVSISNSSTTASANNSNSVLRISGWVEGGQTNLIVNSSTSGELNLINHGSATDTLGVLRLRLVNSGVINVSNSGAQVTIAGLIQEESAGLGFTKTGAGTLTLSGSNANTYSGLTTVNAGVLRLNKSAGTNASAGNFRVTGGTLLLMNSNQIANSAGVTNAGGTINFGGHSDTVGSFVQSSGTFTNGTITAATYALSGGTVAGNFGAGALTVSGNSTITGNANTTTAHITNSTLTLGGTLGGTTTVDSSGTLKGTGSVSNLVVSGTIDPGNSIGTLNAGNTVFNGGGAFNLEMHDWTGSAGTAWDLLSITGNLTLSNTIGSPFTINLISMSSTNTAGNSINFNPALSFTNTFITYTDSLLGETFSSSLFTVNTGSYSNSFTGTFSITNIAGGLALLYTAPSGGSDYDWDVTSGAWSNGANWTNNAAPTNGASIVFSGAGGFSTNNEVSEVAGITFVDGAGEYLVSGDALTIGAFGVVNESTDAQIIDLDVTLGSSLNFSAQEGNLAFFGGVDLDAYALSVNGAKDTLITGDVTGSAGIVKTGAGTLVLTGNNDYSGGTTVNGGRLVGDTDSIQGNVLNNAAVTLDQDANGTYAGNMTGSGSLLKDGSGTVTLGGTNSYGGGTEVANGGIIGTTFSVQGVITNNGTVGFDQAFDGTYAGNMSGSGSLRKSGSGTVTLSGTNSYSGGTEVAAGRLIGTTASLQGDITNNAAVTFSQTTNGTYAGNMSGSGSLRKDGASTISLGGVNSYSGGTEVAAGGLIGNTSSLQGVITNNGTVEFAQNSNGTYSGDLSGTGSVTKSGTGEVTFSGDNSYQGGTTLLDGGTLVAGSDTAFGTGTVKIEEGSVFAKDGVVVANDFVIGSAGTNVWIAGWDFQTTTNGGTAAAAAPGAPLTYLANFGEQAGDAAIYLNGTHGSSSWTSTTPNPQVTSFAGTAINATNTAVAPPNEMSTVTSGTASLAIANSSANGNHIVFAFDMTGRTDLSLSYASQGTATGFNTQTWAFSTNGTSWTDFYTNSTVASSFELEGPSSAITGLDNISTAYLRLTVTGASAASGNNRLDNILLNAVAIGGGYGTLGINEAGLAIFTGNIQAGGATTLHAAQDGIAVFSGAISGVGAIDKTGEGLVTLSGSSANTQTGKVTVAAGILELAKDANTQAIGGDIEVQTDAILLIAADQQVADTSNITLSGGTILRGGDISETFGNLTLTAASTLAYGGYAGSGFLQFGTMFLDDFTLTVDSFYLGNQLRYLADDYAAGLALAETLNFTNSHEDFGYSFDGGTFTITAIPEPSAYVAAAGLLGMMLWPARRRIVRDTKRILGLRTPMRDRLGRRNA